MSRFILPAVSFIFIAAAVIAAVAAARDTRKASGRRSIAARTRIKIAVLYSIIGALLMIWYWIRH